jgi:hypothetical protein
MIQPQKDFESLVACRWLTGEEAWADWVSNQDGRKQLDLSREDVTASQVLAFAALLPHNTTLTHLNLKGSRGRSVGAQGE